jgi:Protein of unknown function (DUF1524)
MRQWTSSLIRQPVLAVLAVFLLTPLSSEAKTTFDPSDILDSQAVQRTWSKTSAQVLNVLDYLRKNVTHETLEELEDELPRYNRRAHFYGWINADPTTNCLDTRTEVLVRDADPAVTLVFKDAKQCNVAKGLWHDPYTGDDFKISTAIQIDHMVPLKNAYLTGAAHWTTSRRCTYGNFLSNEFHLLAVSGHENMSKGSKAPDEYLPPNESHLCEYVANWMKIKAIWNLQATDSELEAIENVVQKYHCSVSRFQVPAAKMQAERRATNDAPARCLELDAEELSRNESAVR